MNEWNVAAHPMKYREGAWYVKMEVEAGVYAYKFVVDGVELIDPANPHKVPNGFGDYNSVIEVGQRSDHPAVLIPTETNGQRLSFRMESLTLESRNRTPIHKNSLDQPGEKSLSLSLSILLTITRF